jgi:uncharacterized repeat protein (TIGR04138 family)
MPRRQSKSVEEVIAETPYDRAAFQFLQEGVSHAVQQVHGPRAEFEVIVDHWMAETETSFDELAESYYRGDLPASIQRRVEQAGGPERFNRHVSGQELSWALRDLAIRKWGLMARAVLRRWGVTKTQDFGNMVFALVNNGYLQAQPTDSIDDFTDVYDFEEAFSALACRQVSDG